MRRLPGGSRQLGLAIALFQINTEGAKALQHVRQKGFATGVRPAEAAQTDLIAHRRIDQYLADNQLQTQQKRDAPTDLAMLFRTLGDRTAASEQRSLHRGGLGRTRLDV